MSYPLNFAKKTLDGTTRKKSAPPGEYDCTLKEIIPAPGYQSGHGYTFKYRLVNPSTSQEFEKTEVFLNDPENERTALILDNVLEHGIDIENVEDLLGMHEHVTLEYVAVRGRSYLNITRREFIEILPLGGNRA